MTETGALGAFLETRTAIASRRLGNGGLDVCRALTERLDAGIAELAAPLAGQRLAVVAVGGYGRGEFCVWSDVDVMLLHGGHVPPRAVETVLYPLWDARLKVGHAVRSVKEALGAARDRLETRTALIDARLIAGDPDLLAEMLAGLGTLLRRGRIPLSKPLAEAERARREREPYQLLEANLKEGRGGLRTLNALHWERRSRTLAGTSAAAPAAEEELAREHLLAARNALHAAAGGPHERYSFDLRPAAAAWLGLDVDGAGRRLYTAMRTADRLSREHDTRGVVGPGQNAVASRVEPRARIWPGRGPESAGTVDPELPAGTEAERATPVPLRRVLALWPPNRAPALRARRRSPPDPRSVSSPLVLAARALDRRGQPRLTAEEAAIIRSAGGPAWDSADRSALLRLLRAGTAGWRLFAALDDLGWVAAALPEWRHTVAAPQHAPIHLHPLDVHLWRTVIELLAITRPESDEPWCAEAAAAIGGMDSALLAALLHDLGKGWPGDHALAGARAAAALCRRARFGPVVTGSVTAAVRHHLLLPTVATRRDIDDPRIIAQVADQAADPRTLHILYLLTVADSRATGPDVWSPWKASLVRSLFARVADEFARRTSAEAASPIEERALVELEEAAAPRFDRALVEDHVRAMPPSYLTSYPAADILRHIEAATPLPEAGMAVVSVHAGHPATNVVVVTEDRPGLLAAVSGVFALHNVSVLDGRFYTRADGIVIDSFHVEDALGGVIDAGRWARVQGDMTRAVRDELALEELLREKEHVYRSQAADGSIRIHVDCDASDSFTVVEIHCPDRVGRLHDITRTLFELGLDIRLAKIDTRGRRVVDTFYVRGIDGGPVRDPERRAAIERTLGERLAARPGEM